MSVEYKCSSFKGWELSKEDFKDKSDGFIDLFCDKGYLHWIDSYSDTFPRVLGIECQDHFCEGEIYSVENLNRNISPEKETTLRKLAEEFFGIKTPPETFFALCVY